MYYFPAGERVALYQRLRGLLSDRGQLVVASLTAPGSIAAAHLNFMLTCRPAPAALPRPGELEGDLAAAGFGIADTQQIVPGEPFQAVRPPGRAGRDDVLMTTASFPDGLARAGRAVRGPK